MYSNSLCSKDDTDISMHVQFVIIDSDLTKMSCEIQLEDEVTGTSTTDSIRTAGTEKVV